MKIYISNSEIRFVYKDIIYLLLQNDILSTVSRASHVDYSNIHNCWQVLTVDTNLPILNCQTRTEALSQEVKLIESIHIQKLTELTLKEFLNE